MFTAEIISDMSNKKQTTKTKTLRVGAFSLTRKTDKDGVETITVRSASDNFSITWKGNNPALGFVAMLWDEDKKDLLHTYIALCYQVCGMIPDIEMLEDWVKLIEGWFQRNYKMQPDLTDDEEVELRHLVNLQDEVRDPAKQDKMFQDAIEELETAIKLRDSN